MGDETPVLPLETQLRMALISEHHLKGEYTYMRSIVASHEKDLAVLSAVVVLEGILLYYICMKLWKESHNGE